MPDNVIRNTILSTVQKREPLALATLGLYITPFIAILAAAVYLATPAQMWLLFPIGLLSTGIGSFLLILLWRFREAFIQQKYSAPSTKPVEQVSSENTHAEHDEKILQFKQSLEEFQQEQERYQSELDQKNLGIKSLAQENEFLRQTLENTKDKLQRELQSQIEQLQLQKKLLEEYQTTIEQQSQNLQQQDHTIASLENRVKDLSYQLRDQKYEIKTLLQLADMKPGDMQSKEEEEWDEPISSRHPVDLEQMQDEPVATPGQASLLLRKCLDNARKITGPSYYSPAHSPFGHISPATHTLDLRRLCESLKAEKNLILFYSPKEEKLLFCSSSIRQLTGWSSDKFIAEFLDLLGNEGIQWKNAIRKVSTQGESNFILKLPTIDKDFINVNACIGHVPTGLFKHYIIAVVYL